MQHSFKTYTLVEGLTMKKKYRVKKENEFQKVFHEGHSVANRNFVVYVLKKPGQPHFRVGLSVGKKIGNAVMRNAVKRKIRQGLQQLEMELSQDIDFIVIARAPASSLPMADIQKNLIHVCKLAGILKGKDREGRM